MIAFIEKDFFKGSELIKPPKLFTPKMAKILRPQYWNGQSKIA